MRKKSVFLIALAVLICVFSLIGCGKGNGDTDDGDEGKNASKVFKQDIEIGEISIFTAEANDDNIWMIRWPFGYYCGHDVLKSFVHPQTLSEEESKYILDYVKNLPTDTYYCESGDYLAEIIIKYKDEQGKSSLEVRGIYREYPEGFDKFAEVINGLCGGDKEYLRYDKNIQQVTPEYFTIRTGLADENIYGGTVSEFIECFKLDMRQMNDANINYNFADKAHRFLLMKMLPFTKEVNQSTDEEAHEYAVELAKKMNVAPSKVEKLKHEREEYEYYGFSSYLFDYIRVYRTESMNFDPYAGDIGEFGQLRLSEDISVEPLQGYILYEFIYSADNKFAVAVPFDYTDDFYDRLEELGYYVRE